MAKLDLGCTIADRLIDLAFLITMATILAVPLYDYLATFSWLTSETSRLVAFYVVMFSMHVAVSFPLSFYAGHILERRFNLSTQSTGRWLTRYLKRTALALVFNAVLFVGLFWVIWSSGNWWWLVGAGAAFVVIVLVGQLAPVLIMPLFYTIEKIDNAELAVRMKRLSEGTGLTIEGVYRMDMSAETVKANAMLAGMGRTRRVLMTDTLLESFTPEEIEIVFAHEIGHHVFGHLRKMVIAGVVICGAGFFLCHQLLSVWLDDYNPHVLPVYALPILTLGLMLFQFFVEPIQNAISRHYERQCDRYALDRTGLKDAYISAFTKLARQNKDDPDPHPLEVFLLHDHPPISERLAMAETG